MHASQNRLSPVAQGHVSCRQPMMTTVQNNTHGCQVLSRLGKPLLGMCAVGMARAEWPGLHM